MLVNRSEESEEDVSASLCLQGEQYLDFWKWYALRCAYSLCRVCIAEEALCLTLFDGTWMMNPSLGDFAKILSFDRFCFIQHFVQFMVLVFFCSIFLRNIHKCTMVGNNPHFHRFNDFSRILFKLIQSKFGGQQSPSE